MFEEGVKIMNSFRNDLIIVIMILFFMSFYSLKFYILNMNIKIFLQLRCYYRFQWQLNNFFFVCESNQFYF